MTTPHTTPELLAREKFEAWAKTQSTTNQVWWFRQLDDGGYSCHEADVAWKAWQAALATQTAKAAPVEGVGEKPSMSMFASVADYEAENLARRFHEAYERLAPSLGYETRPATRTFDPSSTNGRLMIAVCREVALPPGRGMVPMTDSRMDEVLTNFDMDCSPRLLRQIGREVEKAHGISAAGIAALGDGGKRE